MGGLLRTWGKHSYHSVKRDCTKTEARAIAKGARKSGYLARIVKGKDGKHIVFESEFRVRR